MLTLVGGGGEVTLYYNRREVVIYNGKNSDFHMFMVQIMSQTNKMFTEQLCSVKYFGEC